MPLANEAGATGEGEPDVSNADGRGPLGKQPPPEYKSLSKPAQAGRQADEPGQTKLITEWQTRLAEAERPRGRVSVLARLLEQTTGLASPDKQQLGRLVKLAGGGLPGALTVGEAIVACGQLLLETNSPAGFLARLEARLDQGPARPDPQPPPPLNLGN